MDNKVTSGRWFRRTAIIAVPLGLCLGVAVVAVLQARPVKIKSFQMCQNYGFTIVGTQPEMCTANGQSFEGPYVPARTPAVTSLDYSTLYSENGPGAYPEKNQIITNNEDWKAYWVTVHSNPTAVLMLPPVDFTKQTVIAVTMGSYRSNAVGVHILSIQVTSKETTVNVQEIKPGETCAALASTSNPTLAIAFPKQKQPVKIEIKGKSQQCSS